MARFTIKSRKHGETFNFWMADQGGYIRREHEGREGTLGEQLRNSYGDALEATTVDEFKIQCRKWYRNHKKYLDDLASYC